MAAFEDEPKQELEVSYDGQQLHCFTTSPLHGHPCWAVTIGNRTFGTGLTASPDETSESIWERIAEWYEFEKARGTFEEGMHGLSDAPGG